VTQAKWQQSELDLQRCRFRWHTSGRRVLVPTIGEWHKRLYSENWKLVGVHVAVTETTRTICHIVSTSSKPRTVPSPQLTF